MNALILIKIIVISYFIGVNIYGFLLINFQRKHALDQDAKNLDQEKKDSDQEKTNLIQEDLNHEKLKNDQIYPDKKKNKGSIRHKPIKNSLIFLTGFLGGATGIYLAMFVYKFKLRNFFFMVVMPVFIAINVFFLVSGLFSDFWLWRETIT